MTNSLRFLSSLFLLALLITINACSDDDNGPDDPTIERRTSGFVIVGTTGSGNALVKYVEELPTSTIDLSDGQDFGNFTPQGLQENAIFLSKPDGSNGFAKMAVNQDGEVVEIGDIDISGDGGAGRALAIRDANLGVYSDPNDAATLVVFNPATLEVTGTIDLSAGSIPGNISRRYDRLLFRGDNVFAPVRGLNAESFSELIVHVADVSSNTFVGETEREGNGIAPITFLTSSVGGNLTDDNGDFYFGDAGNNGRQGTGTGGAFARINRIPAGSNQIDDSYTFEPGLVLNPQNLILPTQNYFEIIGSGRALAYVNTTIPNEALALIASAPNGNPANLEPDQITQLTIIIDQGVTYRWCELDLASQSVTPIANIPEGTRLGASRIFEHDGSFYLSIASGANATIYQYDPATSTAVEAFTVIGANLDGPRGGVYNLSSNF